MPNPTLGRRVDKASPLLVRAGTTCESEIDLEGRYLPGATMRIFTDGFESGDTSVLPNGRWSFPLSLLEGRHLVTVRAEMGGQVSAFSDPMPFAVFTDLLWNPSSFVFTSSRGQMFRLFDKAGNGAAVADNWSTRLEDGEHYSVSVTYCGEDSGAELALVVGSQVVLMSDPDNDGTYEGSFTTPSSMAALSAPNSPQAAQLAATLVITSDDTVTTYGGTIQAETEGTVSDTTNGQPLEGATVTVFEVTDSSEDAEAGASFWRADDYGQINPQTTGADGSFAFWVPVGTYRFEVAKPGYQPYRSGDIAVVDEWLKADVRLMPIEQEEADYIVEISQDGFSPSALWIRPGSVVKWVNVDVDGHTTTRTALALAQSGAAVSSWDSGVLAAGESFTMQLDDEGTFSYTDQAYPLNNADIVVDANAPATVRVFLPLIQK